MSSDSTEVTNSGGADFIVVANRLPVDLERLPDGTERWKHSPGGLVSALAPFLQRNSGAWVGWPGVPDVEVDKFSDDGIWLHPVTLSAEDVRDYYEGFSNGTLWPLYHDVVATPVFDRGWWDAYVRVNRRFADETAKIAADGAIVWVQDYQLQLVPAMLREQRPDLRIGFFLHIPFPPTELFMQLPWRAEIIRGLLGADLVGFHRPGGAQNYLWLARRLIGLEPSRGAVGVRTRPGVVQVGDRSVRVGAFPISIDASGLDAMARSREVIQRARQIRADLGNPRKIILGVDRLDYTKGIYARLRAFSELLAEGHLDVEDAVFVQVATPSRERVEQYRVLRDEIDRLVGRVNGDLGRIGRPAIHYMHSSYPREEMAALYQAADIMVVTPLRDGMNLVAKEYVACRFDDDGALVLSEFAGAADELRQAFLINPYDINGMKSTMLEAIHARPRDLARRMKAMRRVVAEHDVSDWATGFLKALAQEMPVHHKQLRPARRS
ncbi:MAG: trehalose-6-phosphate synthase [Actinomycetota bacterium]|nr:trehalose-6-phosphate synthase [Actinomycetota bacterium]